MNPFLLRDTLLELANQLPPEDEEAEPHDLLEEITTLLETQLGLGQALYALDDGSAAHLAPDLKSLFEVLCHLQSLAQFLNAITFDGLISVFYNGKGEDLAHLRQSLKRFDPELSRQFEAAHNLLTPLLEIPFNSNFVTTHPGVSPYDKIDEATFAELEKIEHAIDAHWDRHYEHAMMVYNARDRA